MRLFGQIAAGHGVDPGNPPIPNFGRKILNLTIGIGRSDPSRSKVNFADPGEVIQNILQMARGTSGDCIHIYTYRGV